jgi:hypothetical protein
MNKNLMMFLIIMVGLPCLTSCNYCDRRPGSVLSVEKKINQYYQDWKKETHWSGHSDTSWYTSRPGFRKIVGLGSDALPFLEKKLKEDKLNEWKNGDFFLAFGVVEIYGWNRSDFYEPGKIIGEQGFANNVLKRLENIKTKK